MPLVLDNVGKYYTMIKMRLRKRKVSKERQRQAKACLYMNDHILKDIHGMTQREYRHSILKRF